MSDYVSAALRRLVAERAGHVCEYCLVHEDDTYFGCEVEHIISQKHGGATMQENLALACVFCNRHKGTDIGSITTQGHFCRLFNPRADRWSDHFRLEGSSIVALTDIGEVTLRVLNLNHPDRVVEREMLISIRRYPAH